MAELTGKVAIVTGGGGSLGRASATALARAGAAVGVFDISGDAAAATAEVLRGGGARAVAVRVDVTSQDDVRTGVDEVVAQFGRLDIVHNNAALMDPDVVDTTVLDLDPVVFSRVFAVNVIGYALTAKHAIPHMIEVGGGVIVNSASVAGHGAEMSRLMYGTTKSAILGLTRNIATQHGKKGIRCLSISPGVIMTPGIGAHLDQTEIDGFRSHAALDRLGTPEDVGDLVAFLASDRATFLTGTDVVLDGGMMAQLATATAERERLSAM